MHVMYVHVRVLQPVPFHVVASIYSHHFLPWCRLIHTHHNIHTCTHAYSYSCTCICNLGTVLCHLGNLSQPTVWMPWILACNWCGGGSCTHYSDGSCDVCIGLRYELQYCCHTRWIPANCAALSKRVGALWCVWCVKFVHTHCWSSHACHTLLVNSAIVIICPFSPPGSYSPGY